MPGKDEYNGHVKAVERALRQRLGYSASIESLPQGAIDLIYLRLSRKDKITDRMIYNIAMELSVLYRTELKKLTAPKVKRETPEERYQRTYHLYLGIVITLVSGWFIFMFLWVIVVGIWELINGLFS